MKTIDYPAKHFQCECGVLIKFPNLPIIQPIVWQCECGRYYEPSIGAPRIRIWPSRKAWRDEMAEREKRGLRTPEVKPAPIISARGGSAFSGKKSTINQGGEK